MTNIKAINQEVRNRVTWHTTNETIGDRFELERSENGRSFTTVATENAKGKINTLYTLLDNEPYERANYYRLQILGADGLQNIQ